MSRIAGALLIGISIGIVLNIIAEYRHELLNIVKTITKSFVKPKKLRVIQPTIEIYDRNYKKVSFENNFNKVV